jgi:hypothetical protein
VVFAVVLFTVKFRSTVRDQILSLKMAIVKILFAVVAFVIKNP